MILETDVEASLAAVRAETNRAHCLHGENSMLSPHVTDDERLPILGEEFGEVCRGLTYDNNEGAAHLVEELEQLAAMAVSWAAVVRDRIKKEGAPK
jgi:hypothetical protein